MEYKKLKDISTLIGGYAFKSSEYINFGIRVIRIANVQDGYISDEYPCFYPFDKESEIGASMLKENDLLMSLTGNVGRVALLSKELLPAGLNQRVECIRTENELTKEYLYYYFRNNKFKQLAEKNASGIAQLNMSVSWLGNHMIPIYDSKKTKDIINTFRCLDKLIETNTSLLKNYDELIKSRFIEMFHEKEFPICSIRNVVDTTKISAKKIYKSDDEIKYIDISSIDNKTNSIVGHVTYKFKDAPSRAQQCLKTNDILVSTVRPNLRNVALFDEVGNGFVGSSGFCVLRPLKCDPQYLRYIVLSDKFTEEMTQLTNGANYPAIRENSVFDYLFISPPLHLQNEFADFVKQIDKSKFIVQKRIKTYKELLDKKMDEYFGKE